MPETSYQACLRCGSVDLRMPSVSQDAFVPGTEDVMGMLVCGACGHKGIPLVFADREQVGRYQAEREADGWRQEKGTRRDMSVFPATDARPRSVFVPFLLMAFGAIFLVAGFGLLLVARGAEAVVAVWPVAIGLPLVVVGWRQFRARGRQAGV